MASRMRAVTALRARSAAVLASVRGLPSGRVARRLGQKLFAFVGSTLLAGEVRVDLSGGELVVKLGKAASVREKCGAVYDGLRSSRMCEVGGLAAGQAESGQIGSSVGEQVGEIVHSFGVAEIDRVSPVTGLPHVADASQLGDVVADVGWSFPIVQIG